MKEQDNSPRLKALKNDGLINRRASKVTDPHFLEHPEFFDSNDLPQVKYEMLRGVSKEGRSVTEVAKSFGFSRLSFYRVRASFEKRGLVGLTAQKRGPKEAHKLSDEVMKFVQGYQEQHPKKNVSDLRSAIEKEFKFLIHRRSIERALSRRKKKEEK